MSFNYKIKGLKELGFSFKSLDELSEKKLAVDNVLFDIQVDLGFKENQKSNSIIIGFKYEITHYYETSNKKESLFSLKLLMTFEGREYQNVIKKVNNGYQIPDPLLATLFGVVFSTSRGILYQKLKGSDYQNLILPIIDTNTMAKQLFENTNEKSND